MIISGHDIAHETQLRTRLVVIGAGPAGIVTALEAASRGVDVILIETGNRKQEPRYQQLSLAHVRQPDMHAPVELTISRQLGGTSSIWGGRCVPYDRVDFIERDALADSVWPVTYEDLQPYFGRTCEWMLCGRPIFDVHQLGHLPPSMIPGLEDGDVCTSALERWSLPTDFGKVYFHRLRDAANLTVITDATCVRIDLDEDRARARSIECKTLSGRIFTVLADDIVISAGGLESARLLLCSPGRDGRSIGDHSGQLGHWYMSHLDGVIADLVLTTPVEDTIYWYERDIDGSYVRRRFTFAESYLIEHGLNNISGWIANPELSDAHHGNARLSFTYLALISPLGFLFAPPAQRLPLTGTRIPGTPYGMAERSSVFAHLSNMARHPIEVAKFVFDFAIKRVFSRGRKPPGFFVPSRGNRYPLQYHAEHLPHYESCVRLSDDTDELGMPKLDTDIVFTDDDVKGVLAAHRHWDSYLRAQGVGRLEYRSDDLAEAVRERTGGGFHQVGVTRMSKDPNDGVVDENLAVHGVPNLFVVSSSVFVTSGQANSTFMILAFALRLIEHLFG
jgi:GMC oxidoreductase/Pyridine nucleotide-disulphide oxidoreductase